MYSLITVYVFICIRTCIYMYVRIYVYTYICVHIYISIHIHVYIDRLISMCMHMLLYLKMVFFFFFFNSKHLSTYPTTSALCVLTANLLLSLAYSLTLLIMISIFSYTHIIFNNYRCIMLIYLHLHKYICIFL
jgi:hypothetical protein